MNSKIKRRLLLLNLIVDVSKYCWYTGVEQASTCRKYNAKVSYKILTLSVSLKMGIIEFSCHFRSSFWSQFNKVFNTSE